MTAKHTTQDLSLLNQAFGQFNEAAGTLSDFYERLTQELANLNLELEKRNQALAESLAEQEKTKKFLAHLVDNLTSGVLVLDPEGKVTLANQAAAHLLGVNHWRLTEADRVLGGPLWEAARPVLQEGGRQVIILHGPEGRLLSCALSALPWPEQQTDACGVIALIEDVTDQAQIGAQRERSQTLKAMGEMASEIAHQLRNPLGGIELFASILKREVEDDDNQVRLLDHILSGVKQVNHLITNYLTLSRPPRPIKNPVSLDSLLDESLVAAAQALAQGRIEVQIKRSPLTPQVAGDAELLLQVFLSIILNSIESFEQGGRLNIEIRANERQARVIFRDNGRGILSRDLGRIFSPFYTTKEQSLGLGLAISHQIIDAHQGMIQVKSRSGRGTTVNLSLPLVKTGPRQTLNA
jgi:signal transduction histidine kinase